MNRRFWMISLRRPLAGMFLSALLLGGIDRDRARALEPVVVVSIPFSYRTWNLSGSTGSTRISQMLVPVSASVPLSGRLDLLTSFGAQSSTTASGSSRDLNGPTDLRAALAWKLLDGKLVLQSGLNVPSGPRRLDSGEQVVASMIAPPALGFRLRQPGRGLDVGIGASYALPLSDRWALGFGAGHVFRGKFRPTEESSELKPGAETTLSAGINAHLSGLALQLDGTHRLYAKDSGWTAPYKEPTAWEVSLGAHTLESRWRIGATAFAGKKNKVDVDPNTVGSIIEMLGGFSGTYLSGALRVSRPVSPVVSAGAVVEAMRFRSDPIQSGAGMREITTKTAGIGPAMAVRVGSSVDLDVQAARLFAKTDAPLDGIDGWDVRLTLQFMNDGAGE